MRSRSSRAEPTPLLPEEPREAAEPAQPLGVWDSGVRGRRRRQDVQTCAAELAALEAESCALAEGTAVRLLADERDHTRLELCCDAFEALGRTLEIRTPEVAGAGSRAVRGVREAEAVARQLPLLVGLEQARRQPGVVEQAPEVVAWVREVGTCSGGDAPRVDAAEDRLQARGDDVRNVARSSAQDDASSSGCDGRVRGKDAGSVRSRRLRARLRTPHRAAQRGPRTQDSSLGELYKERQRSCRSRRATGPHCWRVRGLSVGRGVTRGGRRSRRHVLHFSTMPPPAHESRVVARTGAAAALPRWWRQARGAGAPCGRLRCAVARRSSARSTRPPSAMLVAGARRKPMSRSGR